MADVGESGFVCEACHHITPFNPEGPTSYRQLRADLAKARGALERLHLIIAPLADADDAHAGPNTSIQDADEILIAALVALPYDLGDGTAGDR